MKTMPRTSADDLAETRRWIRTASDEAAFAAGMHFKKKRAHWACNWMETYLRLYEGDKAGEPLELIPCWRDFFSRLYGWVQWSEEYGEWIRRFTHASFWGAKKNGKSPCCAAHNLYLLCGDGEKGQKVYQAAANGEQARIAQMHAVNMVRQSPALSADCKINNTTLSITHLPTNSVLSILTGDDKRNARSKEGLNGSISYDEMHVVNREMEERTSRAGISRKEPLNVSFSTAGDDLSSVGYDRFQYGRQVNSGSRNDPHFLHVEYSAPDGVTDEQIDDNLEAYGKASNPAWGYIVKSSGLHADWERSKGKPREVARFKQYRLNLWVGSTTPWLDTFAWEKSGEDFTLDDLRGRDCVMGLDLSRTRDMTACVLMFPEEDSEHITLWPMFWLPAETAKQRDHLYPFQTWSRSGHVVLTEGATVDYNRVKRDIISAVTDHELNVQNLFYDEHYANELTQALHEDEYIVAKRTVFKQNLMTFTGPSKEFERRVMAGLVRHPKNAVLTWQVGHVEVKADNNQNIRPVKPESSTAKSIDGIVAAVMTLAETTRSVYESRGMLVVGESDKRETQEPKESHEPHEPEPPRDDVEPNHVWFGRDADEDD